MSGMFNFAPESNASYSFPNFATGTLAVGTGATRGPNISCEMVWLKADPDNSGQVYVGGADVSSTNGIQLEAGDVFGWIPIRNLNLLYTIGSAANQKLNYAIVY